MGPNWGKETTNLDELEIRHKHLECWPSFDAIRQYEWIRVAGEFNMITEMRKVVSEMMKLGFLDAICWLRLCQEKNVFFGTIYGEAVEVYAKETPRNKWFDKDFTKEIQESKKRDLKQRMRDLQKEMKSLESK